MTIKIITNSDEIKILPTDKMERFDLSVDALMTVDALIDYLEKIKEILGPKTLFHIDNSAYDSTTKDFISIDLMLKEYNKMLDARVRGLNEIEECMEKNIYHTRYSIEELPEMKRQHIRQIDEYKKSIKRLEEVRDEKK